MHFYFQKQKQSSHSSELLQWETICFLLGCILGLINKSIVSVWEVLEVIIYKTVLSPVNGPGTLVKY